MQVDEINGNIKTMQHWINSPGVCRLVYEPLTTERTQVRVPVIHI
jgi:hypothetical protein